MKVLAMGAKTSCRLSTSAKAYDSAARLTANGTKSATPMASPAQEQRDAARRGDALAFEHTEARVEDDAEPGEAGAQQGQLHQHAGNEHLPAVRPDVGGEQGAEQRQVQDGLDHPEDQAGLAAHGETELVGEDQPDVTQHGPPPAW
jgi:hypothetical protein